MPHSQGPAPTMTTLYPEDRRPVEQEAIKLWITVATFLSALLSGIYTFFATRQKDTEKRFKESDTKIDAVVKRVDKLENSVEALPSKEDFHKLDVALARMTGDIRSLGVMLEGQGEIMTRLERVVTRHEDHLLEGRK